MSEKEKEMQDSGKTGREKLVVYIKIMSYRIYNVHADKMCKLKLL